MRPINFKKPLSAVSIMPIHKRSAPKLKFFGGFYSPNRDYSDVYEQDRDQRYQNEARMPDSIEVLIFITDLKFMSYIMILDAPER